MKKIKEKIIKGNDNVLDRNEFSFFIENFNTAICLGKPDGSILEANRAALEMFGYSLRELKDNKRQSLFDHTDPNLISSLKIREKEGKIKVELIGIRKNGERFPCEISSTIYKGVNGEQRTSTFLIDLSERKKLENEISLIINLSEESFAITDRNLKLTSFNKQFIEWHKINKSTDIQIGNNILDYTLKKQRNQMEALYIRALNGETIETEVDIIINKEKVILQKIIKPIFDTKCNVIGTFSTSRNITEQKKAQQHTVSIENRFRSIIEHISDIIVLIDSSGKIIYINLSFEKIIGVKLKEIINTPFDLLIHPDDRENTRLIFNKLLKKPGIALSRTLRILHKNGYYIYVEGVTTNLLENDDVKAIVSSFKDITRQRNISNQLKNSEEIIKENLEQLKKLTDNIDAVVYRFEISPTGKMTFPFISDSIYKLIPDIDIEFLKKDASLIFLSIHPDDVEELLLSIRTSRDNLTDWRFEFRQKNMDGEEKWIKGSSNPEKKEDGTVVWYGYMLDITERVISERKLRESINSYNIINKATNDTIWDIDYVTRKINWNDGINRIYGYKNDEPNKNDLSWWYSKIHPDDLQRVKEKAGKSFNKKESRWDDQYRFLCANNTYKFVSDTGYLVKDEHDVPIKMIGAMNDITSQKIEEERLKLLESVITNTTDSVLITQADKMTGDQIIIYANDAFLKMTGYKISEIIKKSPRIFQGPNSDKKELNKLKTAIENNKGCQIEIINYKKTGEEYWVKMSITPVFNSMGTLSHFIAIESDVTYRKLDEIEKRQMITELSQNYKDLKQFSYVTSHNLRSPIANLLGLTSLLDNYKLPDKSLKLLLDGIRQSALIFDDTVKDLTKILVIKDQINIIKEEVSLVFVIEKILTQISLLVNENDINIKYELNNAPCVNFTNSYLESIFLNLFTNSIKYKSSNRKLTIDISSYHTNEFVIVKFKDNGIGIDIEAHKEKLFKLYQRFHDKSEGKGLGLYLIKSQLEAMNGEIEIESTVNVGTTFIVKFRK